MKILLTATVQSHIVQFHKPLVQMLHDHGCEVHVAARDNLAEKNGLKLDFVEKVFDVPFSRSPGSSDNVKAYRRLKRIIDEGDYDVIHCNTPVGGVLTRLAARQARKRGAKVFYTAHGFHFYKGAPWGNWFVWYPVEKIFADHFTDTLIAVTGEDYELAKRRFRCTTERIHGVGVDEKRFFPVREEEKKRLRKEMGFSSEQKILLNVGELLPNKNHSMAIRMMPELVQEFPDALLLIAGNGSERERLEREIAVLDMKDHVRLLGYVTNLQDYQHIADALVSCSYREGLPLNIVESMLSGTPVAATENRGHRELIVPNLNGYLTAVDDVSSLASKVKNLLYDDSIYIRFQQNSAKIGVQYCFSNVKKELQSIYFPEERQTNGTFDIGYCPGL